MKLAFCISFIRKSLSDGKTICEKLFWLSLRPIVFYNLPQNSKIVLNKVPRADTELLPIRNTFTVIINKENLRE